MSTTTQNEAKHTPGKWVALTRRLLGVDGWYVGDGKGGEICCEVIGVTDEEAEANAHIAAAAPELLAALEWAAKCVASGAWKNEDGETPDIEIIRAAIARAKGTPNGR